MLASKFFKEIAEIFDDQGLHAGGKCYHFPWENLLKKKWPGEKFLRRIAFLVFKNYLELMLIYLYFQKVQNRRNWVMHSMIKRCMARMETRVLLHPSKARVLGKIKNLMKKNPRRKRQPRRALTLLRIQAKQVQSWRNHCQHTCSTIIIGDPF